MKILLLGGGGREHALAWKMSLSPLVEKIYVLPGNDGLAQISKVSRLLGDLHLPFVIETAKKYAVDLVVVGPEKPLADGVVDALTKEGILAFGPSAAAAQLESSKVFSKKFMLLHNIPTANFYAFDSYEEALKKLKEWNYDKGVVLKADSLASGKGVVVTHDKKVAEKTLFDFMINPDCNVKTDKILLEEKISGKEVSAFALCNGDHFLPLGYACDYKRAFDEDKGPNTGGMGCYTPVDWPSKECRDFVNENVFAAVLKGMEKAGTPYKGILYAGLMVEKDSIQVLEFNIRFGDPEAQVLLPLIESDLVPLFESAAKENSTSFSTESIAFKQKVGVHVVMASEGYPSTGETKIRLNEKITYPENLTKEDQFLFFAGVQKGEDGGFVNNGGRVLGVTALGDTLANAREYAYQLMPQIQFQGAHWRKDIARF